MKPLRFLLPVIAACSIIAMASCAPASKTASSRPSPTPSKSWALLAEGHREQGRVADFQSGSFLDLRLDDGTIRLFELDFAPPVTDAIRAGDRVQVVWFDVLMIMPPSPNEPEILTATATAIRTNGSTTTVTLQAPTGESLTISGTVEAGDADLSFLKPGDRVHAEHSVAVREITKIPR
ncbi:hypothetical protein [Inquilinus sp. CA228]|uniref:hypothetical protein n=1 Tax=Inquilinus sp. CA228 TaxID=3455609 RepID=UPI003F8D2428